MLGHDMIGWVQRCLDCGQTGDHRLMDDVCHRTPIMVHPGKVGKRLKRFSTRVVGSTLAAGAVGGTAAAVGVGVSMLASPAAPAAVLLLPVFLLPGLGLLGHRTLHRKTWQHTKGRVQ